MHPKLMAGYIVIASSQDRRTKLKLLEYIENTPNNEIAEMLNEFEFDLGDKTIEVGLRGPALLKIGIAALAIVAKIALSIAGAREEARKHCKGARYKNAPISVCKNKKYIEISTKAIAKYNQALSLCNRDSNPKKCVNIIRSKIADEQNNIKRYKKHIKDMGY